MPTLDLSAELTRGYAALDRGAFDDADAAAQAALAGAPDDADAWRLVARVQLLRGDRAAARATLNDGIARAKEPVVLHADLAELALKEQDGTAALGSALEARRLGGDQVRWVLLTGKARWTAGDREGAIADFRLAATHAPDVAKVQIALARALFGTDRINEGIAVLERSVARQGGGLAAALLALATLDADAPQQSLPVVDAALVLTPVEPTLKLLKAMLLALGGDVAAGRELAGSVQGDAHLRARWEMFEQLRDEGCARFVGRPQQVLESARSAATIEGAELTLDPASELAGLPEGALRLLRLERADRAATARQLEALGERLVPGTIVVFDAYAGFPGARDEAQAAWRAFLAARGFAATPLTACLMGSEAALRIEASATR